MRIGIDLGGTKIEGIALAADGREAARRRIPSPTGNYEATVRAVADLARALEAQAGGIGTVGVGMPGAISPMSGVVKNANSTWLIGKPFDRDLAAALGRPVRVMNDANCVALSEATDGAAAGARVVFGIILGTGVGGGIVIDGKPLVGADAIAGEWGHNPLPWPREGEWPGPPCYCGRTGCIETFLSGPGLARDDGRRLAGEEVARRAGDGEAQAQASLARYADRLARSLAAVVNILDPDVVVLGGGLSRLDLLYATLPELLARHLFSDRVATRILPPVHGDASGVRGAAWLWPA
jgi:fructokinase